MRIGTFVAEQNRRRAEEGTNICGVLLQAVPQRLPEISARLGQIDGVEVCQTEANGTLIVTIEDTPDEWAGQIITKLPEIDGVLSTLLIYHHCEAGPLDEEFLP